MAVFSRRMLYLRAMKLRLFVVLAFFLAAGFDVGNACFDQQPEQAIAAQSARHSPERLKPGTILFVSLNAFGARMFAKQIQ